MNSSIAIDILLVLHIIKDIQDTKQWLQKKQEINLIMFKNKVRSVQQVL